MTIDYENPPEGFFDALLELLPMEDEKEDISIDSEEILNDLGVVDNWDTDCIICLEMV